MNLGVRARVFLTTVGLAVLVGLPAGLLLEALLREQLVDSVEERLTQAVAALEGSLERAGPGREMEAIDPVVDGLAKALQVRLTVIRPDGRVLGDSERDGPALLAMDLHHTRPEVMEAREAGRGRAVRYSDTVDREMMYVALRRDDPDGRPVGYVRAAAYLSRVDASIWQLRLTLLLGGALALVLATVSGGLVSGWWQRTMERLVTQAQSLQGQERPLVPRTSMDALTAQLEEVLTELAAERDQREAVLDGVADGVVAVDPEGRIRLLNPAARRRLGEEALERTLAEVAPETGLDALAERALMDRRPHFAEVAWPGPPPLELEVMATPLPAREGCVLVLHDRTEIRKLERVRRDFVANVSHELRTPVSIIAATTETLLDGALDDPDMRRDFVDAVRRHAVRLGELLGDLLSLSRIESGRLPLHPEPLRADLAAWRAIRQQAGGQQDRFRVEAPPDLWIRADRSALDHALGNLVENAAKYAPDDSAISVRARAAGDRVILEVADRGPGIAPSHRDRIFERFYRVDEGRSREVGGTGLGLAIVRHLAAVQGGQVSMVPNEPRGSIFRLELPRAADPGPDGTHEGDAPAADAR